MASKVVFVFEDILPHQISGPYRVTHTTLLRTVLQLVQNLLGETCIW